MQFRIADTFTDSLARLTGEEQKAVKTTAFDLQLNPASPGLQFHKLDRARDRNFWSVRVSADIRLIVHRTEGSLLLCYVNHHDKAYAWAERRRLEVHPKTGAAQLVELRETVQDIRIPSVQASPPPQPAPAKPAPRPALFADRTDAELLGYGVPQQWLGDVRGADEDSLLALADHLPAEAAEALLELATGGQPRVQAPAAPLASPFDHPDAQRRFRVMANLEELQRALEYPWDRWTVFLHPEQREWVERNYSGPARISGSAGTGKTIVALHRAVHLARRDPDARVLLATFSETLAHALQARLRRLVAHEPRLADRIDVASLDAVAARLYRAQCGPLKLVDRSEIARLLRTAAGPDSGGRLGPRYLLSEWDDVIDAWQIGDWDGYRSFARLGRKTRLSEGQRRQLWSVFEAVRASLNGRQLLTTAGMYTALAGTLAGRPQKPYQYAVIDEAQDLSPAQLRFLAALGGERANALFFAGDLGQRIFQAPFSWKALGVDVRGRSRTLRVNYRTSHQIRQHADRLLNRESADVDGNVDDRSDTVSVFNGPAPLIHTVPDQAAERATVARWLEACRGDGLQPHEIGLFVRSEAQLSRARAALEASGIPHRTLDQHVETTSGYAALGTMHLAKGLEFRAVAVMACDDEILPLQERIEGVGDEGDLQEVYDTERHLLYVACTRARDRLLVTGVEPHSEFLDDFRAG